MKSGHTFLRFFLTLPLQIQVKQIENYENIGKEITVKLNLPPKGMNKQDLDIFLFKSVGRKTKPYYFI